MNGVGDEAPIPRRPHHVNPSKASVRLILTARVFMAAPGSHIGLNITADNNMKVLRRHGIEVEVWPTQSVAELRARLAADWKSSRRTGRPPTHVVVSAPGWIHPAHLGELAGVWPNIEFTVLNHSGLAYLSIDKFGVRNNRMLIDSALQTHNIRVAGNNPRVVRWFSEAFGFEMVWLPNLYDTTTFASAYTRRKDYDPLRVGGFGAGRIWKNQLIAAEAVILLARRLGVHAEFYVNSRRPDGGERIIESRDELFDNYPGFKKIEIQWLPWPGFRRMVRSMDLLISPSFDETFCVVAADGIAEGIPSVVGPAMEWAPSSWQCAPHDPHSVMGVGLQLLHDPRSVEDGRRALQTHVNIGIHRWIQYLTRQMPL